jgi:DNA-binding GntR family transcriptional regulator
VLEVAGVRNWEQADEADREGVRRALVAYTSAVREGASYQRLNERHLAVHASLVGLLGSPRLTAFSEALASELKLALAQIDRVRRNAHDQADSHLDLVGMLERGEVEAAAERIAEHLAEAEHDIVEALGSGPPH